MRRAIQQATAIVDEAGVVSSRDRRFQTDDTLTLYSGLYSVPVETSLAKYFLVHALRFFHCNCDLRSVGVTTRSSTERSIQRWPRIQGPLPWILSTLQQRGPLQLSPESSSNTDTHGAASTLPLRGRWHPIRKGQPTRFNRQRGGGYQV